MIEKDDRGDARSDPEGKGTPKQHEIAISIDALKVSYETTQANQTQHSNNIFKWTRRGAKAAILYTGLTLLLFGASIYSVSQTREVVTQTSRAAKAAEDQVQAIKDAASEQVVALNKQIEIAKDTEERSLRAYAFASPTNVQGFTKGSAVTAGISITTMGQTPAYNVRGIVSTGGMAYPLRDDQDLDVAQTADQIQNRSIVVPGHPFIIEATTKDVLNQSTVDAINAGTTFRLYTWGRVDYDDVFAKAHWLTFCYNYNGELLSTEKRAETCPRHNDYDQH